MFIRKTIAKGHAYYHIVEGVREGDKVRQRFVVALGCGVRDEPPTLQYALDRMRKTMRSLRRRRSGFGDYKPESKSLARDLERLDARIAKLQCRIDVLSELIKSGMVVTTHKQGGK